MTKDEFIKILIGLQNGDISALEIIYNEYFQKIFYTAYDICHDKDMAYDIATDVILKLGNLTTEPLSIKNHKAFLVSITKNQTKDYLKKSNKIISIEEQNIDIVSDNINDNLLVDEIMSLLNDDEKLIFREHIVWDKSLKLIAKEQQKPYITVKRIFAEIKKKLKKIY